MDRAFVETCRSIVPPMNERVMNGYLCYEIADQERRVEETLRKAFDGRFGGRLRCGGLEQCDPQESYIYAVKPKNPDRSFELEPSDIYLTKSQLFFDDVHLVDVHIQLLSVEKGALSRINRTLYSFRPTIADKVISPENKSLFVRVDQFRTNVMQLSHPINVNNRYIMESEVVWGQIHKSSKEKKAGIKTKARSCLVHYLLGHYGFTEMFNRFTGSVPIIGDDTTITEEKYPSDEWMIVKTAHNTKPVSCAEPFYKPTQVRLAVRKEHWTSRMKAYVMSVFYIVDSFPSVMTIDKFEHLNSWRLTLGQILFAPSLTAPRLLGQIEEHFNSSDTYMDVESIHKLRQNGHEVKDFRDLMALLAGSFNELLAAGGNGSLYGKYLDTLRDVLDPVIYTINDTKYELMELELKKGNMVTPNNIRDCIVRKLRSGAIFENNKNSQLVEATASCTDHPHYKMTSRLGVADRSSGGKKKTKTVLGERHHVTTSKMMVGSLLNLSKHNPILESHINPWVITDDNGTILEDPTMKEELARVDAKLSDKRGRN